MQRKFILVSSMLLAAPFSLQAFPALFSLSAPPSDVFITRVDGLVSGSGTSSGDKLGWSASTAGDFNHDGVADVAFGAPSAGPSAGSVWVIFGSADSKLPASLSLATEALAINGAAADGQTGYALAAGDVNADGVDDVIIGAPGESAVYAVLGPIALADTPIDLADSNTPVVKFLGPFDPVTQMNARSGYSVSVGDINNDTIDDIAIGNGAANLGVGYVVFGGMGITGGNLAALNGNDGIRLTGGAVNAGNFSVAVSGDVDGDQFSDLLVGSYQNGTVYILFGRDSFAAATVSVADANNASILQGGPANWFGFTVAGVGDLNGDGLNDIAAGAPLTDIGSIIDAGRSHVIFGRAPFPSAVDVATQTAGNGGFRINGFATSQKTGWAVAKSGDVNGDNHADLIIGSPFYTYNLRAQGAAHVVFGKTGGFTDINLNGSLPNHLDGINGFNIIGIAAGDQTGFSVAGAGDVDGDGADDLLLGAPNALFGAGSSFLVYGQPSTQPDTTPPSIIGSRTRAGNGYGWNNTDVTVGFTCTDSESGIKTCTSPVIVGTEAAGQSVTGSAVDNAGNTALATVGDINIDKTAPTVTVTGVVEGGVYTGTPFPGCNAEDSLSGIAVQPTLTVVKGQRLKNGTTTYTATCSGAMDKADNIAADVSVTYQVKKR